MPGFPEHLDTVKFTSVLLFLPQGAATTWCCFRTALQRFLRRRWRQSVRVYLRCWAHTSFLPRKRLPASVSGAGTDS